MSYSHKKGFFMWSHRNKLWCSSWNSHVSSSNWHRNLLEVYWAEPADVWMSGGSWLDRPRSSSTTDALAWRVADGLDYFSVWPFGLALGLSLFSQWDTIEITERVSGQPATLRLLASDVVIIFSLLTSNHLTTQSLIPSDQIRRQSAGWIKTLGRCLSSICCSCLDKWPFVARLAGSCVEL